MGYEYDPLKNESNLEKHGLYLSEVEYFEWDTAIISEDFRLTCPEKRFEAKGYIEQSLHILIFCFREKIFESLALEKQIEENILHMPKLKPGTIIPSVEDDALINAGITADPDSNEFGDDFLLNTKAASDFFDPETYSTLLAIKKTRGRPKVATPKVFTAIRLDADLVETFKGTGKGWQTRVNAALRQFLIEHPILEKEV